MAIQSGDILLVEDNPLDIELTLHTFRKHNLVTRVQVVEDGAEALDYIFCSGKYNQRPIEKQPKVILLDNKLPKVDGFEVLRRVKSDERTKNIPVVMVTTSDGDPNLKRAYSIGANGHLTKPLKYEAFSKKMKSLGLLILLENASG